MELTVHTLTPDMLPSLEDLFRDSKVANCCWCMYWRIGNDYRKRPESENKAAFSELVENGLPPGLLAFDGDMAVGWCQLTPRDALPWLERSWRLKHMDRGAGVVALLLLCAQGVSQEGCCFRADCSGIGCSEARRSTRTGSVSPGREADTEYLAHGLSIRL